jgi:hypothetical protein
MVKSALAAMFRERTYLQPENALGANYYLIQETERASPVEWKTAMSKITRPGTQLAVTGAGKNDEFIQGDPAAGYCQRVGRSMQSGNEGATVIRREGMDGWDIKNNF